MSWLAAWLVLPCALAQSPEGADPADDPPREADAPEIVHPTTWTGRRVARLQLLSDDGVVPEDLEPLLLVREDALYNPQDVRQDLHTLYRVGSFARIEVEVQESVQFDASGAPVPDPTGAIVVIYRLYRPPRLASLRVEGNRHLSDARVLALTGRARGDQFFPEEAEAIAARIEAYYHEIGWIRAVVRAETADTLGEIELTFRVEEGEPQRIGEIHTQPQEALSPLWLRARMIRHRVRTGRPLQEDRLRALSEDVRDRLLRKGYFEPRVRLTPVTEGATTDLTLFIEPGRPYHVVREPGSGLPRRREIVEALHLAEGALISRRFEEDASDSLTRRLQAEGYLDAVVDVRLEPPPPGSPPDRPIRLLIEGERGPAYRLGATTFTGDDERSPAFLRGALQQAGPAPIQRGFYTEEGITSALEVMREYYRTQGFLSAELSAARPAIFADPPAPRHPRWKLRYGQVIPVDLSVQIDLGPRTTLLEVTAKGNTLPVEALWAPLINAPLNPAGLDALCQQIIRLHQEAGYLYADAKAATALKPDQLGATVTITVDPGPLVKMRSILIQGNRRTRREVIAREIDLKTGAPLSPSALSRLRRRLYALDVFSRVDVEPVGDADRLKDVLITVEERPNLYAEVGGSAATDQGVQAFGRGGFRNLFGAGHRLTLLGQAGLGWSGDSWSLDLLNPEWSAAARYEAPDLPGRDQLLLMDMIFNAEDQERFYRLGSSGLGFGVRLAPVDRLSMELAWKFQFRRLLDADPALLVPGDPWLDLFDGQVPAFPTPVRATSGPSLSLLYDLRDDPLNPRKGAAISFELRASEGLASRLSEALPDESPWARFEGGVTGWIPFGPAAPSTPGLVLRLRGGASAVRDAGTLPVEERFRLGGGSSLRGFAPDSVGPANLASSADLHLPDAIDPLVAWASRNDPRWIPTGGDSMLLASVEISLPFPALGLPGWEDWQLALFADAGNVWFLNDDVLTDSIEIGDDPPLRTSVGFGLRLATVVGPIQLDLGFNLDPIEGREEAAIEGFVPMQLHVSLGAL